jgi:dihydroorotate dehydrogenase electron transfer subunit
LKLIKAILVSNSEPMPGARLLELEAPDVAGSVRPGQFVMVHCQPGAVLPRPFSVHRISSDTGRLFLLFAVKGSGTAWLSDRSVGEAFQMTGPLGNTFSVPGKPGHVLMVAGGLGIAPLTFLAEECIRGGQTVTMVMGAACASGLLPGAALPANVRVETSTEDGSHGRKGMVTDLIPEFAAWADRIYACGPAAMYRTISQQRASWPKATPVEVSLEVRMGCGTGICYGCTIKTKHGPRQVCVDGPVFKLENILWDSVVC